jgi:hypothetical protein
MNLVLEALSAMDGTGIIRNGQTLRLLRPPYTLRDSPVLPESSIRDAILRHGFAAAKEHFGGWEEAVDFLNRQAAESRRSLGKEIPEFIAGGDIVDVAPEEVLTAFLERVETELIPGKMFDHAENFLVALLSTGVLTRYPALGCRAARLLQRNKDARQLAGAATSELMGRDLRFVSLEKHGELERSAKLAESIRQRHCVFAA